MPSDVEIRELATKTAAILQGYLNDTEGWHTSKKTKDLIVEYKHSVCPGFEHGYLYRGQTEYNCSKDVVFKYIDAEGEGCLRLKWDKDVKNIQLLKQIDPDLRYIVSMTNSAAKGLIAPRDFVDVILVVRTETCISTNGVSIELDEYPPDGKFVRGFNHPSGMMCLSVPDKPNSTRVVTFIQSDIKGLLPRSLVDAAIPKSMAGFFNNLRTILKKDGHLAA
ncbi:hypothetical protein BsWGS_00289 [Bradybaena similaris]